jgi:predicted secreted protein
MKMELIIKDKYCHLNPTRLIAHLYNPIIRVLTEEETHREIIMHFLLEVLVIMERS